VTKPPGTQSRGLGARARGRDRGALAIVLHTHMPYVEGFGTWPFGEEWLWEAMVGSYLPLVELLDGGAPLTLSLTPVLCDQLEAPGLFERFVAFVEGVRRDTHEEDAAGLRAGGHETLARELDRSFEDYARALESLHRRGGDLLGVLAPHAQWTSAATHAVLPLLASDAGVRLQVHGGIASHRRRFGEHWRGGFWLPECAYTPWLGRALEDAGVRVTCVELTNRFGLGASEHLSPLATESGVLLVPVDRSTMSLVWDERGYPASGAYRDYHHNTIHHHNPWSNDGGAYDHAAAQALAREHAADFVSRTLARLRDANDTAARATPLPGGGLVVCALDTELLGHWWYEGVAWLAAVVEECARQGLELVRLDDASERHEWPAAGAEDEYVAWPASTWGRNGDLSTWSGPAAAPMAFAMRAAELEVVAAGGHAGPAAVRELLALQASDWPFMVSREIAVPYARERFDGHRRALAHALASGEQAGVAALRNLAVDADRAWLLDPS
jgi:1,4-alpha-glucan branching enzyme